MSKMLQKLLAVGLALAFLLSMPGVSAIVEAASSAVLTAEQLEAAIVAGDGEIDLDGANIAVDHTLTIENTVTISNGTISRSKDVSIFEVKAGGCLTLNGVRLEALTDRKTEKPGTYQSYKNSPVVIDNQGKVIMNDGSVISGFTARHGGGANVKGTLILNSGAEISGNIAQAISSNSDNDAAVGGGIYIDDGGYVEMNAGSKVNSNKAQVLDDWDQTALGGGIAIKQGGAFTMNGGEVNDNSVLGATQTAEGGGICIGSDGLYSFKGLGRPDGSKIQIKAGTISGNKAYRGAGIYIHEIELNLKDVYLSDNDAGRGAGVWFCVTGVGTFYSNRGGYFSGNKAQTYGDDFYSVSMGYPGYKWDGGIQLPTSLPDGTPVKWYLDARNDRYEVGDEALADVNEWVNDELDFEDKFLHSEPDSEPDMSKYALFITGNHAEGKSSGMVGTPFYKPSYGEGGGIACNGSLIVGDKTGDLTVKKEVVGYDTGKDFSFKVTLDEKLNGVFGDMTFADGVAEFNLKNGESLTAKEIPEGTGYTVEEKAEDGYNIAYIGKVGEESVGEDKGTIQAGKTTEVTVQNTWPVGDLTVSKAVNIKKGELTFGDYKTEDTFHFKVTLSNKEINGTFGYMDFENGEAEFDLKKGESKTATGLPANTHYTVTETAKDGYTSNYEGNTTEGDITANGKANASFVNTRKTGNLSVKKVVSAKEIDKEKAFNFTVKLDTPLTGTYGDMTFTDGEARFTLTHEETKTATGLPTGIKYTVTEEHSEGYITSYTSMTAEADENGGWTGEIAEGVAKVTVTNIKNVGDLTVTKVVDGSGDLSKKFNFTVTLSGTAESGEKGEEINGQYGDMAFKGGVAHFELKSGESKSANNLPIGLEYTVTEAEADKDDYKTSYAVTEKVVDEGEPSLGTESTHSGNSGKIGRDSNGRKCQVVVKVTNTRPYGSLSIKKAIEGAKEGAYEGHVFKFKVTGQNFTAEEPLIVEVIGSGAHTLSHLIPGEYTIEEVSDSALLTDYDWNGVKFTDANGNEITKEGNTIKVIVKADENTATEVVATNSYTSKLGKLTITKEVKGLDDVTDANIIHQKYTFDIIRNADNKVVETVTLTDGESKTVEDLTPGTYTVKEVDGDIKGYTKTVDVSGDGQVTVTANKTAEVTVTNAYTQIPGSLKIVKTATYSDGAPVPERTFRFTVTGPSYHDGREVTVTVGENGHGESEVLDNLIPGEYTVTEDAEDAKMEGYELVTTVGGVTGFSKTVTVDHTSETKPVEVEAVNTYTQILGNLKIVKEAKDTKGNPVGVAHTFTFTVTGPSYPDGREVTVTVDENGHGESEVLKNLIPGEYTVAEVPESAKLDGYYDPQVEYVSSATVKVEADKTATASVTVINTYEKQYGGMKISKHVEINNPSELENYEYNKSFKIRVYRNDDGFEALREITEGQTIILDNLEPGVYTVEEIEGDLLEQKYEDGSVVQWSHKVTGESTQIVVEPATTAEGYVEVNLTNIYSPIVEWGELELTKDIVLNNTTPEDYAGILAEKNFRFIIDGPLGYQKVVTLSYNEPSVTLKYLVPGIYTVTEEQSPKIDGYEWVEVGSLTVEVKAMQQAPAVQDIPAEVPAVVPIPIPEAPEVIAADMIANPAMNAPAGFGMNVFGEVPEDQPELFPEEIPEMFVTDMPAPFAPLDDNTVGDPAPADQVVTNTEPARLTVTNTYNKLGSLVLTKNVTGTYAGAYGKTYSFTVTGPSYPNGTTVYVAVDEDGHGETQLDNLKPGTYTVDENDKENLEQKGFVFNVTGEGTAAVEYGETVGITVTNDYKELGKLTVTKSVVGLPEDLLGTEEFNFEVRNEADEAVAEFTLKNGESHTVEGLKPGTYTVTEKDAKVEGYDVTVTVTGEGTAEVKYDATALVTVTNTYEELGKLTVTKKVEGLDGVTDENILNHEYSFEVRNEKGETVDAFTLKDGKSYTVENLKPGTYEIIETNNELEGYKLDVKTDGSAEVEYGKTANVTVTNSYKELGKLTVTKSVAGDSEEAKCKLYTFKIEGPDGFVRYVTVTGNGSVTVDKLEPGTYTVTEVTETYTDENGEEVSVNLNIDGYAWEVTGQGQEVVIDLDDADKAEGEVTVTNTYTRELGSLTITKSVEGNSDEAEDKVYTFNVTGPDGYSASVTVTGSGSTTLTDLVPGTYTVTEDDAEIEGFELEVTGGGTVDVVANETAGITVTNTYTKEVGSLTITKTVAGDSDEAEGKTYTFDVSGPDGYAETVNITGNGSVTLTDLVPGVYTVTERNSEIDGYELTVTGGGTVSAVVVKDETATAAFTNTYRELRSISVTKEWYVDGNRAFAPAGASITVNLLANGADTGKSLVISESTGWAGTFEELYVNDENGEPIAYSISEQSYLGWQSSVTGSADSGFVVINSTTTPPDTPDIPNIPDNPYYPTTPEYPTPEEPYIPPVDIPEPEVPLTDIPDEPEVPLTDIVDDEVPLFDKVPETGDESNTALWISIAACSALGIAILAAALIRDSKKTRKED